MKTLVKNVRNWWSKFYNSWNVLIWFVCVLHIVVGLLVGLVHWRNSYLYNSYREKDKIEYVTTEKVDGHSYIKLRHKEIIGYRYYILHDPDCSCNN